MDAEYFWQLWTACRSLVTFKCRRTRSQRRRESAHGFLLPNLRLREAHLGSQNVLHIPENVLQDVGEGSSPVTVPPVASISVSGERPAEHEAKGRRNEQ